MLCYIQYELGGGGISLALLNYWGISLALLNYWGISLALLNYWGISLALLYEGDSLICSMWGDFPCFAL